MLPSDIIKLEANDFTFNLLVAEKGIEAENKANEKRNKEARMKKPRRH